MSLVVVQYDELHKLSVSYLVSREYPPVLIDHAPLPVEDRKTEESCQLTLNIDYTWFSFVPSDPMKKKSA